MKNFDVNELKKPFVDILTTSIVIGVIFSGLGWFFGGALGDSSFPVLALLAWSFISFAALSFFYLVTFMMKKIFEKEETVQPSVTPSEWGQPLETKKRNIFSPEGLVIIGTIIILGALYIGYVYWWSNNGH